MTRKVRKRLLFQDLNTFQISEYHKSPRSPLNKDINCIQLREPTKVLNATWNASVKPKQNRTSFKNFYYTNLMTNSPNPIPTKLVNLNIPMKPSSPFYPKLFKKQSMNLSFRQEKKHNISREPSKTRLHHNLSFQDIRTLTKKTWLPTK